MDEKLATSLADLGFYGDEDVFAATLIAIDKILALFPRRDRWCVEFGAWDGIWGSNTRHLIENQGYSAVLIEGNKVRFRDLQRNYADRPGVTTLNQFVGFDATDGLDAILEKTGIPRDFDFCCIDIDGNDYHTWNACTLYQPKLVCIEFNPTIPPEVGFVQAADPAVSHGCSLTALVDLARRKGYELASVIGVNAFFVDKNYYPLFGIMDNSISALWTKRDCITYLFSGYDGRIFLRGCQKLPWHENFQINESRMQVLPPFIRRYPYNRRRHTIYTCLTNPFACFRVIRNRLTKWLKVKN